MSDRFKSSPLRLIIMIMMLSLVVAACSDAADTDADDAADDDPVAETDDGDDEADEDATADDDEADEDATADEDEAESEDADGDETATDEEADDEAESEMDEADDEETAEDEDQADGGEGATSGVARDFGYDLSGHEIRITSPLPDALGMPGFMMQDILAEWGADVEKVEVINIPGLQAVVAGEADLASQGIDEVILGAAEGSEVVAFAVTRAKMDYVLVGTEDIESVEDLAGKNIGMSGPAGFDTLTTRLAILRSDIDLEDVNFVQIGGSPDRAAALLSGQIDAATVFISDWNEIDERSEDFRDVVWMSDVAGDVNSSVLFGNRSYLDENPDVAEAAACANLEAFRWAVNDRDGFIQYTMDNVEGASEEATALTYDQMMDIDMYPPDIDQLLIIDGIQEMSDTMLDAGEIDTEVAAEDIVDRSFLEAAWEAGCGQD